MTSRALRFQRFVRVAMGLTCLVFAARLTAEEPAVDLLAYMSPGTPASAHVLGFIKPDGTDEQFPDFGVPPQASWGFGPQFRDLRRMMFTSYGEGDVTKVRAGRVKTRTWIYDWITGESTEALMQDPPADQVRGYALIADDSRVIATGIINGEERIFVMDLDGGNRIELTDAGGGFHYALALSDDQQRLALHVTGGQRRAYNPGPYSINVLNLTTRERTLVAGQPEHLYFGPRWSPDQRQLVFQDCLNQQDPKHFRSGVCIGQVDGSGHRLVTPPQSHWFGTPFGSNMPEWSPDGKSVTYSRLQPDADREMQHGGCQICLVDAATGAITELTPAESGTWDYRTSWAPDGGKLTFTRVRQGGSRELWMMNRDGSNPHRVTSGFQNRGADFARWVRVRLPAKN